MVRAARTRIAMLGAGTVLFATSGALAREGLGEAETALFRRVNDPPTRQQVLTGC